MRGLRRLGSSLGPRGATVALFATTALVASMGSVPSPANAAAPAAARSVVAPKNVAHTFKLVKQATLRGRTSHRSAVVRKVWKDPAGRRIWYKGDPSGSLDSVVLTSTADGGGSAQVAIAASGGNCCDGNWQQLNNAGPGQAISFGFDVESNDIHARAGSTEKIASRFGNGAVQDVVTAWSASGWSNDGLHDDNCNLGALRCARVTQFWTRTIYLGSGGSLVGWDPQGTQNVGTCGSQTFGVSGYGIGVSATSPVCPNTFGPHVISAQQFGTIYKGNMKEGNVIGAGGASHERFVRPSNGGSYQGRQLYMDITWAPFN